MLAVHLLRQLTVKSLQRFARNMSLLLDALQRASKEKEKLAGSRANSLGPSVSKTASEPSEDRSPFPALTIEKLEERKDFEVSSGLSIEPIAAQLTPLSQPDVENELAVPGVRQEEDGESVVPSFAIEGSESYAPSTETRNELGSISPAVAEISETLAVPADPEFEKIREHESSASDSKRVTTAGNRDAATMHHKASEPSDRSTQGMSTSHRDLMPSPHVAKDILDATTKRLPNRRLIALGSTALSVAGIYLTFHLGAFDQFFGKSVSSLTPASPPPPVVAVEQAPPHAPAPVVEQKSAEVDAKAKRVEGAAGTVLDNSKISPSQTTSKVVDEAGLAKPSAERTESTRPVAREAKARQAKPTLVVSTTTTSALDTAYAALSAGQLDIAADLYRKVLSGKPAERDAFLGLAYIAQRKGNNDEAKIHFLQVLRIDPGNYAASSGLLSIAAEGDLQQAASRAREMAERAPDSAVVMGALGGILAKEGRIAEAQQAYFRALTLEPENAFHAFNLAVALDKLHKNSQALGYYQRAMTLAEKMPVADRSGFPMKEARDRVEQLRQSFLERQLPTPPDPQSR